MRREEFSSHKSSDFKYIVENAVVGHLGLIDQNGFPRIIPLNFVCIKNFIYFHGALEGEKHELLKKNPKVAFSIDIPYSYIPSHFISKNYACPATHFFKSAHIRGIGGIVEHMEEKATVLQALMKKYQPEGNHITISSKETLYKNALQRVGVYYIKIDDLSVKIKFGQDMKREKIEKIIEGLRKRNRGTDAQTILEIGLTHSDK